MADRGFAYFSKQEDKADFNDRKKQCQIFFVPYFSMLPIFLLAHGIKH